MRYFWADEIKSVMLFFVGKCFLIRFFGNWLVIFFKENEFFKEKNWDLAWKWKISLEDIQLRQKRYCIM